MFTWTGPLKQHLRSLWMSSIQINLCFTPGEKKVTFLADGFGLRYAQPRKQLTDGSDDLYFSVCHRPPVVMDHGKAGNRYSALFSPGRFCFLLYHAPSSGDFSSAISSSSSSNTSSAVGERKERMSIYDFLTQRTHTHAPSLTLFQR